MGAVSILLLALLLAFPGISIEGASGGLLLWYQVVLPTLSPFMICTQMVSVLGGMELLMKPFYPLLHGIFGLSLPGAYVMLCGLLCGYPLGAKMCSDFCSEGRISREEAAYLLAICNHPSPMFLLGYVRSQLPNDVPPALLFACLYLPVLPLSLLAGACYRNRPENPASGFAAQKTAPFMRNRRRAAGTDDDSRSGKKEPVKCCSADAVGSVRRRSLEEVIGSTCETMVLIGGYIMLFSILAAWINHLKGLPLPVKAVLAGAAEITSGVHQICTLLPAEDTLPLVIGAVAFGGLSGIFQTKSVIRKSASGSFSECPAIKKNPALQDSPIPERNGSGRYSGLSIRHYVIWKMLHAALSCLILTLLLQFLPGQAQECWQIIRCGWKR